MILRNWKNYQIAKGKWWNFGFAWLGLLNFTNLNKCVLCKSMFFQRFLWFLGSFSQVFHERGAFVDFSSILPPALESSLDLWILQVRREIEHVPSEERIKQNQWAVWRFRWSVGCKTGLDIGLRCSLSVTIAVPMPPSSDFTLFFFINWPHECLPTKRQQSELYWLATSISSSGGF